MLHTVVNNRRLHLANGADYQGSVNSYNNFITKSITKSLRFSQYITINNEKICVNKKSYHRLLSELKVADSDNGYKNFDRLTCSYINNRGLMRNRITAYKSEKLGRQFINAFLANDMQKATRLLGQGANIDKHFWLKEGHGPFFNYPGEGLSFQTHPPFKATKYTPFLYAVSNNNEQLKNLLQEYQANEGLFGQECQFERKIIRFMPGNNYTYGAVYGQDQYHDMKQFSYDPLTEGLNFQSLPDLDKGWTSNGYRVIYHR